MYIYIYLSRGHKIDVCGRSYSSPTSGWESINPKITPILVACDYISLKYSE